MMKDKNKNKNKILFLILFFNLLFSIANAELYDDALNKYNQAKIKVSELESENYPVLPLYDLLNDAQSKYNRQDYSGSMQSSNEIFILANRTIFLRDEIISYSNQLKVLSDFGVDMTQIDLKLLYVKADYEAANFDLSEKSLNEIKILMNKIAQNYSEKLYFEISSFNQELNNKNIISNLFENYYKIQSNNYRLNKYDKFLSEHVNFAKIKKIILMNISLKEDILFLESNNVKVTSIKDKLMLFNQEIDLNNLDNAIIALEEAKKESDLAKYLILKTSELTNEYNRLNELEILNNKTIKLYNSVFIEFDAGNFNEANKLINNTLIEFQNVEKENIIFRGISKASLRKGIKEFLINNWIYLLLILIIIIFLFNPLKNHIDLKLSKRKLINLNIEKDTSTNTQKELQKAYYFDKTLEKTDYVEEFERNEEIKVTLNDQITTSENHINELNEYFSKLRKKYYFSNKQLKN